MGWESTHDFPTSHLLLIKKGSVGGKQQRTLDVVQKAITLQNTQGPFRIKGSEKCDHIIEAPEKGTQKWHKREFTSKYSSNEIYKPAKSLSMWLHYITND